MAFFTAIRRITRYPGTTSTGTIKKKSLMLLHKLVYLGAVASEVCPLVSNRNTPLVGQDAGVCTRMRKSRCASGMDPVLFEIKCADHLGEVNVLGQVGEAAGYVVAGRVVPKGDVALLSVFRGIVFTYVVPGPLLSSFPRKYRPAGESFSRAKSSSPNSKIRFSSPVSRRLRSCTTSFTYFLIA